MKKRNRILAFCTAICMVGMNFLFPAENSQQFQEKNLKAYAEETATSGTCGENLTWMLNDEGTLTVSGTGKMTDYSYSSHAPWYNSRESIKKVIIQNGAINIGNYAFYSSNIVSIDIPDSVTTIGSYAFLNSKLSSIVLPENLTVIGEMAFQGCKELTSITIPDNITCIETWTFIACTNLKHVTLSRKLKTIYASAFFGCFNLDSIIIPESVQYIGDVAFGRCSELKSISILNPNCKITDSDGTISDTATIYGYINSTAQAYAEKYNRKFVSLDADSNQDNSKVTITELNDKRENLIALQSFLLKRKYYGTGKVIDVNKDNKVNIFDLCLAKRELYKEIMALSLAIDSDDNDFPDCLENDDHVTDTDGDGLCDYDELMYTNTNPLFADSDENGVSDGDEDPDGDSISNIEELKLGTNPLLADSDFDDLTDEQEVALGTNPMEPDTDGDGAEDGWEILNGYDPLIYDATFEITAVAETPELTASAALNGNGAISTSLEIEPVNDNILLNEDMPGYIGSAFDFSTDEDFESATISFDFDKKLLSQNNFIPTIYYFNEETQMLEELETTITGNKASAVVSHFSTYVLLNKEEFDKVWEEEIREPGEAVIDSGMSVFFVLDRSGSMDDNDPSKLRYQLTNEFISSMDAEKDFAGIITYNSDIDVVSGLSNDFQILSEKIKNVSKDAGGTEGTKGINEALTQLQADKSDNEKYIIFMTDGDDSGLNSSQNTLISDANAGNVTIYTIGLGNVKESALKNIATSTKGRYFNSSNASGLMDIFKQAQTETIDYRTDSNNDGISDYYTKLISENKLRTGTGTPIAEGYTYEQLQASDDWDEDGKLNNEEINVTTTKGKVRVSLSSSPILKDTDTDGISDYTDTAPNKKGLGYGIGELSIVACFKDGSGISTGHSWLVYKSYVDDVIDSTFSKLTYYNSSDKSHSLKLSDNTYSISSDNYMSIGCFPFKLDEENLTYDSWETNIPNFAADYYNWIFSSPFQLINLTKFTGKASVGGIIINDELYYKKNDNSSYFSNNVVSYTRVITQSELEKAIKYLRNNNYYTFNHNCTTVAVEAWNAAFGKNDGFTHGTALFFYTPKALKEQISSKKNADLFYGDTMLEIIKNGKNQTFSVRYFDRECLTIDYNFIFVHIIVQGYIKKSCPLIVR